MHPSMKKKKTGNMDLDILDELIGKCESSMMSPLHKGEEVAAVAVEEEPEIPSDGAEDPEMLAVKMGESLGGAPEGGGSELDDMDLEELMEMYKRIKGG